MRIIAGEARGRKIKTCKGIRIRPTADRVKETIFNLLGDRVVGVRVLDLFAGCGNLGIEALSRGASRAVFLDLSLSAASVVAENLESLGFRDRGLVMRGNVFKSVPSLARRGERFEVIFADPPYERNLAQKTIDLLSRSPVLTEDGMVVVEHSRREAIEPREFLTYRSRKLGDTVVTILVREVG